MNLYALLPLAGFLVNVPLAAVVLARSPAERPNRLYALIGLALAWWSILKFAWRLVDAPEPAMQLFQLSALGWCLIPALYLDFACTFTGIRQRRKVTWAVRAAWALSVAFAAVAFVPRAMVVEMVSEPWGYSHVPGTAYRLFSAYFMATFLVVLAVLARGAARAPSRAERTQIGFIVAGLLFPLVGGVATNMLLPMAGIHVVELGEVLSTVNAAAVGYAMVRHELLSVSLDQAAGTILATMGEMVLVADHAERIVLSNDAATALLGLDRRALRGQALRRIVHAPEITRSLTGLERTVETKHAHVLPAKGPPIPVLASASPIRSRQGTLRGVVVVARDVREILGVMEDLERTNAQLRQHSVTDELTGTWNRQHATDRLREEFDRSVRYGRPLSVGLLDLDDFKRFNDEHGHGDGDRVLKLVAQVLRRTLRHSDSIARWGGDEFMLVLPETDAGSAGRVCPRMVAEIAAAEVPGLETRVRASLGFATFDPRHGAGNPEQLIRAADEALGEAKRRGKGRAVDAATS